MQPALQELDTAFQRHKTLPFPKDCADDELSVLFAEIVDYDSYTAGLIDQILHSRGPLTHDLVIDTHLRERLERIVKETDPTRNSIARTYIDYLAELETLIRTAQAVLVAVLIGRTNASAAFAFEKSHSPTEDEVRLIQQLLAPIFMGREELITQAANARVRWSGLPHTPKLIFELPSDAARARVRVQVPVEGRTADADGVIIRSRVYVVDGRLSMIDFQRDDLGAFQTWLDFSSPTTQWTVTD